jgi:2-polyprenyl-3-methyl-5-hydroxy-6-metoxy-1,4-benzoquinol methylase
MDQLTPRHDKRFFEQHLKVWDGTQNRGDYLLPLCLGKKVLHVGCTDWPVFRPEQNLHIKLVEQARRSGAGQVDGCDTDSAGIDALRGHAPGLYFDSVARAAASGTPYDIVIVPEVLEHVPDASRFLAECFAVEASMYFFSAPNFMYSRKSGFAGWMQWLHRLPRSLRPRFREGSFTEMVHPDHKCWYSPYTLLNVCRPHIRDGDVVRLMLLGKRISVAILITRGATPADSNERPG